MSTTQSINGDDATSLSAVGENSIINVTGEKANEKTNITRKVYISHDEALRRIIERIGPNEILPNWSTDDLKGLLVQIMRNRCDEMGVQNFAKYFENTSVNEILHSIQQIRKINKDADSERLFHQQFLSSSKRGLPRNERAEVRTDRLDMTKPKNWPEMLNAIRKARKIPDDTTAALSDLLTKYAAEDFEDKYFPVSDTPGHRSCDKIEAPYYDDIYSHLSLMVSARSLKNPRSIDSAIMLDIFDQLEKDIEKFPDMIEFFKQYFNDLKTYNSADFKIDTPLNADNIASISVNTLSLPDDLLDRSNFESRSNERSK